MSRFSFDFQFADSSEARIKALESSDDHVLMDDDIHTASLAQQLEISFCDLVSRPDCEVGRWLHIENLNLDVVCPNQVPNILEVDSDLIPGYYEGHISYTTFEDQI